MMARHIAATVARPQGNTQIDMLAEARDPILFH